MNIGLKVPSTMDVILHYGLDLIKTLAHGDTRQMMHLSYWQYECLLLLVN